MPGAPRAGEDERVGTGHRRRESGTGATRSAPVPVWARCPLPRLLPGALLALSLAGAPAGAQAPVPTAAPGSVPGSTDAAPTADAPVLLERQVVRMGTRLTGRVWAADRRGAASALEAAFRAVRREEELLSTWTGATALARLNRSRPGRPRRVDGRLHDLLREAWRIAEATDGAFDPAVGSLVDAWDLRGEGRRPTAAGLEAALASSGRRCFVLGEGRRVERVCPGAWIDAGAFGKGSGLRRARDRLREEGVEAALLDFGGQLVALGSPPERRAWPASVAHPDDRARTVARLALRDVSAATTASSERFVVIDGEVRGHVLDPRSGEPVPPWGGVTVVARDPMRADALSTALFVMGPSRAIEWSRGREDVAVLVLELEEDGGVAACWNEAMERHLVEPPARRACSAGRRAAPGTRETGSRTDEGAHRNEGRTSDG